ncbi:MAG: succinyl-diaminopimelate desuccinylase [Alphaproteobacteria bacterium]|nr:MAG: succinyl-diaminopimelate desuccinylase [Alphaproteobacteria bacterium]
MDVIELTQKLIACPSITPKDEGALVYLAQQLETLGFTCHRLDFGEGDEHVPNLFARLGTGAPHICYAGHTDVVPTGPADAWTYGPFNPHIEGGVLYGRGASDMKGSVAAFTAAVAEYLKNNTPTGSISLLITGDEEGPALNGTIKVLKWMKENNHIPDVALIGEPTNPAHLGQEIKIGRRGSLTGEITVSGKQGHVAYQHLADNPLPKLVKILDALSDSVLDEGSEFFPSTNLEITTIDVGNTADNVIANSGSAKFNIRFNDRWSSETLSAKLHEIIKSCGFDYDLELICSAESFLTKPGDWSDIVREAVKNVTGNTPDFTTNGGTSDARFVVQYCPVVEFGGINATIHQIDENASVQDLKDLTKIFTQMLKLYFKG